MISYRLLVLIAINASLWTCHKSGDQSSQKSFTKQESARITDDTIKTARFYRNIGVEEFVTKLSDLPIRGQSSRIPHSGSYYPDVDGGVNRVLDGGTMTVLQKYDAVFNSGKPLAVDWEKKYHTIDANHSAAEWSGHCNGFAAAAQRHREPEKAVRKGNIIFTAKDIKALLAEVHMSAKYFFLGGKRCEKKIANEPREEREDPTVLTDCEDVNPGTFHANLANWIGVRKRIMIMDEHLDEQVWNFPVYRFESQVSPIAVSDALSLLGGRQGQYPFNPAINEGGSLRRVRTRVWYARANTQESLGRTDPVIQTYEYILEIDKADEIVGGEWLTRTQHPDFIWVALEPVQGPGTRQWGNPYVDVNEVIRLWAESVGEDPDNPTLDIMEPVGNESWGELGALRVTLDGNNRGAVFDKEKVRLVVSVEEGFDVKQLAIKLNNSVILKDENFTAKNISLKIPPGEFGLNKITFNWTESSAETSEETLNFHRIP